MATVKTNKTKTKYIQLRAGKTMSTAFLWLKYVITRDKIVKNSM